MSRLTSRGRAALFIGLLASASLCAGSAVALVDAVGGGTPSSAPSAVPSLIPGDTTAPTASPSAAAPTSSPSARPTSSPSRSASPRASAVASPATSPAGHPSPAVSPLFALRADASLNPASGDTTTATLFQVLGHATDSAGTITGLTVAWGDGASQTVPGTTCSPEPVGDCRNFASAGHRYATTGFHEVTVTVTATDRTAVLHLRAYVAAAASPSPSP